MFSSRFFIPLSIAFFISIAGILCVLRIRRKKSNWDDLFKQKTTSLNLRFSYFYGKLHAYGKYKDTYISFAYAFISRKDWMSPLPFKNSLRIMGRMKIPRTSGKIIHLAFASNASPLMRSVAGWQKVEDDIFIHGRGKSSQAGLDLFNKISLDTKNRIRSFIGKYGGSCAIANDWETVMIGKNNALNLVEGDKNALSNLDFQFSLPLYNDNENISKIAEEVYSITFKLANELK